ATRPPLARRHALWRIRRDLSAIAPTLEDCLQLRRVPSAQPPALRGGRSRLASVRACQESGRVDGISGSTGLRFLRQRHGRSIVGTLPGTPRRAVADHQVGAGENNPLWVFRALGRSPDNDRAGLAGRGGPGGEASGSGQGRRPGGATLAGIPYGAPV